MWCRHITPIVGDEIATVKVSIGTKKERDSRMQQFLSRRNFTFGLTAIGAYLTGCKSGIAAAKVKMPGAPNPPMAPAALKFEAARSDPYDWLRNREDPRSWLI